MSTPTTVHRSHHGHHLDRSLLHHHRVTRLRTPLLATVAFALSAVLGAIGSFADLTGNDTGRSEAGPYLASLGIALVGCGIVFGLVVRGAPGGNAARRSIVLGALALVSAVVFWTGLPTIFAFGALGAAMVQRDTDLRFSTGSKVGLGLAALGLAGAVVGAVAG